ncbi:hypothetical protein SUGI_0326330 [Cryptomeria japonica]|nr:hypothetical protein SUGI_0326330 [Cryptomeria japonica]
MPPEAFVPFMLGDGYAADKTARPCHAFPSPSPSPSPSPMPSPSTQTHSGNEMLVLPRLPRAAVKRNARVTSTAPCCREKEGAIF